MPTESLPEHDEADEADVAADSTAAEAPADERTAEVVPFPQRLRPDAAPPRADQPRPKLRHVIGDVLRDERHRQGRTLADVAETAAVSLQYLSEVERGTKDVSSDLLEAVHTALGLDLPTVLERANRRLTAGTQRRGELRMLAA